MKAHIQPSKAEGEITAPPSKSMAHRMLICAGLAEGESIVQNIDLSEDIRASLGCLSALGVRWEYLNRTVYLQGIDLLKTEIKGPLPCRESGSSLRFFIPLALATGREAKLTGSEKLISRPLTVYEDLAREKHFTFQKSPGSVRVQGPLIGGEYRVAGNISSQFISGLLFTLPLLAEDSLLIIEEPVESASYIRMTREALDNFGIIQEDSARSSLLIPGRQTYQPRNIKVEGDYSNAAFLDAFNLLDGSVSLVGLNPLSNQGDRVYRDYFARIQTSRPSLSLKDCPDLGPILFALAAVFQGAEFTDTDRLAIKESNRITAMAEELEKFNVHMEIAPNRVFIPGGHLKKPVRPLNGHNDHRIVMACSVLASLTGATIEGVEAVAKSFPSFFQQIQRLGIEVSIDETH